MMPVGGERQLTFAQLSPTWMGCGALGIRRKIFLGDAREVEELRINALSLTNLKMNWGRNCITGAVKRCYFKNRD